MCVWGGGRLRLNFTEAEQEKALTRARRLVLRKCTDATMDPSTSTGVLRGAIQKKQNTRSAVTPGNARLRSGRS